MSASLPVDSADGWYAEGAGKRRGGAGKSIARGTGVQPHRGRKQKQHRQKNRYGNFSRCCLGANADGSVVNGCCAVSAEQSRQRARQCRQQGSWQRDWSAALKALRCSARSGRANGRDNADRWEAGEGIPRLRTRELVAQERFAARAPMGVNADSREAGEGIPRLRTRELVAQERFAACAPRGAMPTAGKLARGFRVCGRGS